MRVLIMGTLLAAVGCTEKKLDAVALRTRGVAYRERGDYDRAIQDFEAAIKLKPDMAGAYSGRGIVYQLKGDHRRAIQDFDQALKLNPRLAIALKNRGRAHFFLGQFAEAAADLRQGLTFDSSSTYNVIWLHLALKRLPQDDAKDFAAQLARTDSVQWPAPIARFYLGRMTAAQLVAVSATMDSKTLGDQRCAVAFYIGEDLLWKQQPAEARRQFEYARANCPKIWTEYLGAVEELRRLDSGSQ